MKSIIIQAESDLGVHIDGARLGPIQLAKDIQGFYKGESLSFHADDSIIKSRNLSDRAKNKYEINEFNEKLYKSILEKIKAGYFPLIIGGDKSVTIPSCLADAKDGEEMIQPTKTVLIGVRNMNAKEKDNIKYSGINIFTTDDIKNQGAATIIQKAFEIASYKTKSVHICYDLDIIDPGVAPGISVPEFNGIDENTAMELGDEILNHFDKVSAYDLVELNPLRDVNRKTEQIALNLLFKVIKKIEELPDKKIEETD